MLIALFRELCCYIQSLAPPCYWPCDKVLMRAGHQTEEKLTLFTFQWICQRSQTFCSQRGLGVSTGPFLSDREKPESCQMLRQWNKGNTEKGVCMDENKESQPCKRLSHSIEEILRRPTVQRSWSVIRENSRLPQPLSCAGTLHSFLSCWKKKSREFSKKKWPPHFHSCVTVDVKNATFLIHPHALVLFLQKMHKSN